MTAAPKPLDATELAELRMLYKAMPDDAPCSCGVETGRLLATVDALDALSEHLTTELSVGFVDEVREIRRLKERIAALEAFVAKAREVMHPAELREALRQLDEESP